MRHSIDDDVREVVVDESVDDLAAVTLADAGEIDVLRTDSGEAVYRRCSTHHHHHLVCRQCGRTVEVDDPPVENWAERIADEHGFAEVHHTVEIIGLCPRCQLNR